MAGPIGTAAAHADFYRLSAGNVVSALTMSRRGVSVTYHSASLGIRFLNRLPVIRRAFRSLRAPVFARTISESEGAFYLLQHETVRLTQEYYDATGLGSTRAMALYNRHYRTSKFDSAVKYLLQREIKLFLVWLYQQRHASHTRGVLVVPGGSLYRFIVGHVRFTGGVERPIRFHGSSGFGWWAGVRGLLKCWSCLGRELLRHGVSLTCRRSRSYAIGFRAHWPRKEGLLRTDFLIDGKRIHSKNMIFYLEEVTRGSAKRMRDFLDTEGYSYVVLNDLRFPLKALCRVFMDYVWLPTRALVVSVSEGGEKGVSFLTSISRLLFESKIDLLLDHFKLKVLFSFHSAGYEPLISPVLCQRRECQFALYNFGITAFQAPYADYAFQNAHVFFSWGPDMVNVYRETQHFDEIVNTGFWGFPEYRKALAGREKLRVTLGVNPGKRVVVFYDIPYFPERSSFTAVALYAFYRAAIACANLDDTVVILKMKNRHNENLAIYPSALREGFQKVWQEIRSRPNMTSSVTLDWDPLQMIAVSDANVSLELSTPSTIALLCGKAGFFFNTVEEYVYHPLFPKYKGRLIFDDTDALVEAIKRSLDRGDNGTPLVEPGDLDGYNAGGDEAGLERFRIETLRRAGLLNGREPELARVVNGAVVG
jgi:hypothetical protein